MADHLEKFKLVDGIPNYLKIGYMYLDDLFSI